MSMAKKPPVHVVSRDDGWAVVREGNERATSIHPTQAEAAKAGRKLARKDGSAFLLHAKDGRVRDRSDYGEGSSAPGGKPVNPVAEATRATGDAVSRASGIVSGAVDLLGRATQGATRAGKMPDRETDETEEVGGLVYEERYAEYEVYDQSGERQGKVDAIFLDEDDELEYVGVKTGLLGIELALIPAGVVTVDDRQRRMVVARPSNVVEQGPTLPDQEEPTPEFEERVRRHYGLDPAMPSTEERRAHGGTYGAYYGGPSEGSAGVGTTGTEGPRTTSRSGATGEEELRVQRAEEELRVGTTKREAGTLRVRKRVRTDRERMEVPVRREEVRVERVPVSGEATEVEIGAEEVVVPVIEEEVVVFKRPVVKEEVRIRKDVVEDTEIVEEDVRREEIDVEDDTERRRG
jgi:uncharacterized protein (TIGR02271 family)